MTEETKSDLPPDHLAVSPASKHFDGEALQRGVGIKAVSAPILRNIRFPRVGCVCKRAKPSIAKAARCC